MEMKRQLPHAEHNGEIAPGPIDCIREEEVDGAAEIIANAEVAGGMRYSHQQVFLGVFDGSEGDVQKGLERSVQKQMSFSDILKQMKINVSMQMRE